MLTIRRTCSNRIITRALAAGDAALLAVLVPGGADCEVCENSGELADRLAADPEAIIVYNQSDEARATIDALDLPATQIYIEIRQDTGGVLGLEAYRGRARAAEALELIDE